MPREVVARFAKEDRSAVSMSFEFGVSVEAMHYRLDDLGIKAR